MKSCLATRFALVLLASSASASILANSGQAPGASSMYRGQAAFRAGRFGDAAQEYERTLTLDPTDSAARTGLMRSLLKAERVAEAARAAERGCGDAAREAPLLAACADVWFRKGDFARAAQMYGAAVTADPACARGHWGLGRVDLIERRNRSASTRFATAYRLDPVDPDIALDWAFARPARRERIAAIERYLAVASAAHEDAGTVAGVLSRLAVLKAMKERETIVVSDPRRAYRFALHEAWGAGGTMRAYRLSALLNGEALRLALDTGTSGIYLNGKAAKRAHLVPVADGIPVRGLGDEGSRATFIAFADSLKVGDLEMQDCAIKVDSGQVLEDADGVIGTDVFSRFLVRLNFPGRAVELLPPALGDSSIADDFWAVERQARAGFMPVHVVGHLLLTDGQIDDVPGVLLVIDSGAPTPILSTTAATRIPGLHLAGAIVRGISGRVRDAMTSARVRLAFGHVFATLGRFPAVNLDEQNRQAGTELGGLIGLDVLRQFDLTIDYTNGLVRFDRPHSR